MEKGFWEKLKDPVVGLAPMDGVTDAAFRYMVCKYSNPSFVYTEFANVEGLSRGGKKKLTAFIYDEIERPIVGQLFGVEVKSFYKCAVLLCYLGFDGVDINMGCPVLKIAKKGSGAALIKTPELAREIIRAAKRGVEDWAGGIGLRDIGFSNEFIDECDKIRKGKAARKKIPVSVKTRIGYDKVIAEDWVKILLEERPSAIIMHGRTLKQLYRGEADWALLKKIAGIVKGSGVKFIGNGDVKSMEDAKEKIKNYGVDGVMVGRAVLGNPWFFSGKEPTLAERFDAALKHCKYFNKIFGDRMAFNVMRKHLGWYLKGFEGARELRTKLMQVDNIEEVEKVIKEFIL